MTLNLEISYHKANFELIRFIKIIVIISISLFIRFIVQFAFLIIIVLVQVIDSIVIKNVNYL